MNIVMKPIFDFAEIVMGQSPTGDTYNHIGDGLPLLNGPTEFGYYNPECTMFTTDSKRESKQGDLIFCVRGSTTGKMNWADQIYSLGRGVCAIRGKSQLKTKYIKYCLDAYLDGLLQLAGGGTFPNLSRNDIGGYKIPYSEKVDEIASILSAYDDLIENNLKRIKLLEEKAFLRYKGILGNEIVEEKKLNQVTQFLKRGVSPKYVNEDGIIVLNQKCIRNHIVSFEDSRLTDPEKNIPGERMIRKFDTLINSTGTGTLGRIAMNIQDELTLTADSHITIVRANHEITPIYLCMSLFAKENVIEMMGEGATNQTELSPKKIGEEIKIQIVSIPLMNEFEKEAESIFNLVWNLQKQNTKLREARDILLPRLMSGEIEV